MILTPDRLLSLAVASKNAYATNPHGLVIDAGHDIRVVLTELDEYLVVAGRGTELNSEDNVWTDLDAMAAYHVMTGWAPRGFLNAAVAVMPLLGPHLAGRSVLTTGHSLAGAFMGLVSVMMVRSGRAPSAYAFFEPAHSMRDEGVTALAQTEGYVSRFGNDPVPPEPPFYLHPCKPTVIGKPALNPFSCHSIDGVIAWLKMQKATKAA